MRIIALTLAWLVALSQTCCHAQPVTPSELAAFLKPRVPSQGWIEVIHIMDPPYPVVRVAAFDFGSGAWYLGQEREVTGNEADGRPYLGAPLPGKLASDSTVPKVLFDNFVENSIPTVIAWDLARRPEIIEAAQRHPGGGFSVTAMLDEGMRHSWAWPPPHKHTKVRVRWEFDDQGRVLTISREGRERRPHVFRYLERNDKGFDVCTNMGEADGYSLLSFDCSPVSDAGRFAMKVVEARFVAIDMPSFTDPLRKGMKLDEFRKFRDSRSAYRDAAMASAAGKTAPGWGGWWAVATVVGLGGIGVGAWWWVTRAARR